MLPCDGPVFVRLSGSDDEVSVYREFELARQIFADKQSACIRSLYVVRHRVCGLVYVKTAKRSLISVEHISFDKVFADSGYINCTDMCPSRV